MVWPTDVTQLDTVITGGQVMLPGGELVATDVGIVGHTIAAIGDLKSLPAKNTMDATGLYVLPGLMDTQVHLREPGLEYKEDLESGTRGAVLGGVTTVFEMPNTKPPTLTGADLETKFSLAKNRAWTNVAFFIGAAAENVSQLAELETHAGCSGVKLFMGSSTGGLLVDRDDTIEAVLRSGRRRVAIHAEDEPRLIERKPIAEAAGSALGHPEWRDVETALRATQRILALAEKTKRPVHVLHITTAEEAALLAKNKHLATMEVLPQHLTLSSPECYERLGSYAQMNPPIREQRHQDALWQAINAGVVDVIASDHAPHTREEKDRPYPQSPSGLTGVQTIVPIMLNHVNAGRLSLARLVDLMCESPLRVFGLKNKGRIVVGYDADLTLVDMNTTHTFTHAEMATKSGWTPYESMTVKGFPVATMVRGQVMMKDGELVGTPEGERCQFW